MNRDRLNKYFEVEACVMVRRCRRKQAMAAMSEQNPVQYKFGTRIT